MSEMVEPMAEQTMVERVGDAIAKVFLEKGMDKTPMDCARAAIAAMREPTEAMVDAYVDVVIRDGKGPRPMAAVAPERWQAMIDVALKD